MLSLIGNVIVLNLHGKDARIEREIPKWLENIICIRLASLIRMKKVNFDLKRKQEIQIDESIKELSSSTDNLLSLTDSEIIRRVSRMQKSLNEIWNEINNKKQEEKIELKWKYAALVMDRFFFIISIVYFLVTFISIVLTVKNLYRPI